MKRKDSKGRILRSNEYVRPDGRYSYQYKDAKGNRKVVYSWRLVETDAQPRDKPKCDSLREMEKVINKDVLDGIDAASKVTLNSRWDSYIDNKPELKQSTRTNYKYMYNKYVRNDIGRMPIKKITYSVMKKFFNELIHEGGFKPNSVETVQTILHPVFTIAIRDGLIRTNPTDGLISDLKRSNDWEKTKRHSLTADQQNILLDFVRNHKVYAIEDRKSVV